MPVPTNNSPKSKSPSISDSVQSPTMETAGTTHGDSHITQGSAAKESMILVQVNLGETFTIQSENSVHCIEGPAQVPMVSPNGSIPPIQVPRGYFSHVIEDPGGPRRIVVTRENQLIHFPRPVRVPPTVHLMPTMSHIPHIPGTCYNIMQQTGIPGNPLTFVHPPHNHSNVPSPHGTFTYTAPDALNSGDPTRQHATTPPHWLSSSDQSSSGSLSSASPGSAGDSPRSARDMCRGASARDVAAHHHMGNSVNLWDSDSGLNAAVSQRQDTRRGPAFSPNRTAQPESVFDLRKYLSAISKPEVTNVAPRSASLRWSLQYSAAVERKLTVTYELHLGSKTKGGDKFVMVESGNSEATELKDLKPGVEYLAKVLAEANTIKGAFSEVATFRTLSCPPSAPVAPKSTHRTKSSLTLKWHAPNDNGEKISKYFLEWDEGGNGGGFRSLYADSHKQFKLDKLRPSQSYTFRLRCQNAMGVSPWSPEVTYQTSGAPPPTPDPPVLAKSFVQSLHLRWDTGRQGHSKDVKFSLEMDDGKGYGFMAVYDGCDRSHTVAGLRKSCPYQFRLRAYNDDGKSGFSPAVCFHTSPDKPSPPGKVTLRGKAQPTHFKVSWGEPVDNGGATIDEYILEFCLNKGDQMEQLYRGQDTEFTVTNACPGSTYRLRVFCVSQGGTSMPSEVGVVPVPPVVPGQCMPPWTPSKPGSSIVHLQWGPPAYDGGSPISQYQVALLRDNAEAQTVFQGDKLCCSVPNLKPGKCYQFAVRAANKAGAGQWSEFFDSVTGPAAPEAPHEVQTDHVTSKTVNVSWKKPHDNGSAITKYIVQYGAQESTMNCHETVTALNCTVHHLSPNFLYFFRVQCENDVGRSKFSEVVSVMTAPSCPGCVSKVRQIEIPPEEDAEGKAEYSYPGAATSAFIKWDKPSEHGAVITGYHVEVSASKSSKDKSGDKTNLLATGPELSCRIKDLAPDKEYRVRVRAVNDVGVGQYSPMFTISTQPLPPDPPLLECIPSCSSLKLRWNSNDDEFKLQMMDRHGRFVTVYGGPSKSHRIQKLEEKTEYVFRISAQNEAGEGPFSEAYHFSTTTSQPPPLKSAPTISVRETTAIISWESVGTVKGDRVSYALNIKSSDSADVRQAVTDETDYLIRDVEPGVEYAVQIAIVRHARVTSGKGSDKARSDLTQADEPDQETENESATFQEQPIRDSVTDVYEDVTGPFGAWTNFKSAVPEMRASIPQRDAEAPPGKVSAVCDQVKAIVRDERMTPAFLMMGFFVLAFISAYLVQSLVD